MPSMIAEMRDSSTVAPYHCTRLSLLILQSGGYRRRPVSDAIKVVISATRVMPAAGTFGSMRASVSSREQHAVFRDCRSFCRISTAWKVTFVRE